MLRFVSLPLLLAAACSTHNGDSLDAGVDPDADGGIDAGPDAGLDPVAPWPEWAFHHWVWEDESTQQSAIELVDGYLAHDIPVGAIIIDSPWETSYNSFVFDRKRCPDPRGMIDYFHGRGVPVFPWMVSAINVDSPLYARPRRLATSRRSTRAAGLG